MGVVERESPGAGGGADLGLSRQGLAGLYRTTLEGAVVDCNEAFARILGWPDRATLLRSGVSDLYFDPREREGNLARVRQGGTLSNAEVRMRRRDGKPVWVVFSETLSADAAGREILEGALVDVTDRREMEARLLQAERLASVVTLAAGVAHEVNNPLSYVLANLSFAQEQVTAALDRRGRGDEEDSELRQATEALQEAREGAERVRAIVRDLRMYARAEDERRTPLDLARVMDSAINVVRSELAHRARVVRSYRPSPPVRASEGKMGQVLLNLLLNAAQAMPDGSTGDREIRVTVEPADGGRVLVEVADNGMGMAPEVLARAFEPFFTTRQASGATGLGLPICQTVLASLGGEIILQSEEGSGTRARVLLPAAGPAPASAPAPAAAAPSPGPAGRRVLVVDDDPGVGSAVRRLLLRNEVVVCGDSQRAQELLAADSAFDVILCDLFMPGTSGMELYRRVRAWSPEVAGRMVFISAGAYTDESSDFLDAVPNERLEKPFDAARLRALVARAPRRG